MQESFGVGDPEGKMTSGDGEEVGVYPDNRNC